MVKSVVSRKAYAKINLHLEVLGKQKNGFHNIVSVFQTISLADELYIKRLSDKQNTCIIFSPAKELPKENTITKAYKMFSSMACIKDNVEVNLIKRIPIGAGLGGGSSDAATVLLGLNEMFGYPLNLASLEELAISIGSDVPFFLKGGTMLASGRGEILKPLNMTKPYFGVLVYPGIESSTPRAYALLNRQLDVELKPAFNPEDFCTIDYFELPFFNSFEEVLFKEFPVIKALKMVLTSYGADFALMSGTGSSVYGLFTDKRKAEIACNLLSVQYEQCFLFFYLHYDNNCSKIN